MGFYIELHCDTDDCPFGGNEEGVQGNNRATVAKDAKAGGWRKVGGRWLCPGCAGTSSRPKVGRFAYELSEAGGKPVSAAEAGTATPRRFSPDGSA